MKRDYLKRGGFSNALFEKIEEFRKVCKYTCWHVEDGDELVFYEGLEPFGVSEYRLNSEIYVRWKDLQKQVRKELKAMRGRRS